MLGCGVIGNTSVFGTDFSGSSPDTPIPFAGVAQSAEQRFCKPQVAGSSPTASSLFSPNRSLDVNC